VCEKRDKGGVEQNTNTLKSENGKSFNGFIMFTFICVTEWLYKPRQPGVRGQAEDKQTQTEKGERRKEKAGKSRRVHTHIRSVCSTHSREITGCREVPDK